MSDIKLSVVAAAIRDHDGTVYSLPAPKRHAHVIWHMADLGIKTPITGKQGFVTSEGGFVGREEAAMIALHAGQIDGHRRELFSEDLW